jgi:hypothetical protein
MSDQTKMVPVRLRGHHFLCLLTYKGLGYTSAFVENMSAIVAAINAGRPVMLVKGADDICNALSAADRVACDHDCMTADVAKCDEQAMQQVPR